MNYYEKRVVTYFVRYGDQTHIWITARRIAKDFDEKEWFDRKVIVLYYRAINSLIRHTYITTSGRSRKLAMHLTYPL